MRTIGLIIAITALGLAPALASAAAAHHRPRHHIAAHRQPAVPAGPAHHMSALAAAAQARTQSSSFTPTADGGVPYVRMRAGAGEARFGAYGRSYKMDADRPLVRPDQDGAVGLSFRIKTH